LTYAGTNTCAGGTLVSNGTLLLTGKLLGAGPVTVLGELVSTSVITGPVMIGAGGGLRTSPDAAGTLTISNTLTLAPGSGLVMKLNQAPGAHDRLRGLTQVNYGGTLMLTNLPGTLAAGDAFQLFEAQNYSGQFDSLQPATPGTGLVWDTGQLAVNGTLAVVRAISAVPPNVEVEWLDDSLWLSWPADHTGWRLQTQTSSLAMGLGNDWVDVSGGASTNRMVAPIDPLIPGVFFRLVYP
jgi:hypothetical protein